MGDLSLEVSFSQDFQNIDLRLRGKRLLAGGQTIRIQPMDPVRAIHKLLQVSIVIPEVHGDNYIESVYKLEGYVLQ